MKTDYTLVHNIIYGAIEYAGELGFLPHKSFDIAKYILEEDEDHIELIDLAFGYKGKPLYISSPERPAERNRVLAQLDINPGRGKYNYIVEADAPAFFEKEFEKERDEANYHDPDVKRGIIKDFIARTEGPAGRLFEKAEKLLELTELSDTIFYEYMVTDAELEKASETIEGLFDFGISDEPFSDEMLAGTSIVPVSHREIRSEAGRLLSMSTAGHTTDGLKQSRAMMDKYPGYLPLAHMLAVSFLLNKPDDISRQIGDSLHLKKFYPLRKIFSTQEVLLYMHMLTINYSNSGEFTLIEEMLSFIDNHFPGIVPETQTFTAKLVKIPFVAEWCGKWVEGDVISREKENSPEL